MATNTPITTYFNDTYCSQPIDWVVYARDSVESHVELATVYYGQQAGEQLRAILEGRFVKMYGAQYVRPDWNAYFGSENVGNSSGNQQAPIWDPSNPGRRPFDGSLLYDYATKRWYDVSQV